MIERGSLGQMACLASRSCAFTQWIPFWRKALLPSMCVLGKVPPGKRKTLIPNNKTDAATIISVSITVWIIFLIFVAQR